MDKKPFTVDIPESALVDLDRRLRNTRWPADFGNGDWSFGAQRAYLEELVDHWLTSYDWREQERRINAYQNFRVTIDDVPIHFICERGKGPNPMPIIFTHGYPMTFWDYHKLVAPLTDPASFGGDPADSFDVVIPSLPGYVFSSPLRKTGVNFAKTADMWVTLMRDVLGYDRFAAGGGDWGTMVTSALGHKYAEHLYGIHMTMAAPMEIWGGDSLPGRDEYDADEQAAYDETVESIPHAASHTSMQILDPQTQAYGLHDSPVAQLAWMVEIRRTWSDCGGDVEAAFTKDELITQTMLYWITETYVTAARYYAEATRDPWTPVHDRHPVVEAPTALALFPREVFVMPKRWNERYYNLQRVTHFPRGGHFSASEVPDLLAQDIVEFFRPLRTAT